MEPFLVKITHDSPVLIPLAYIAIATDQDLEIRSGCQEIKNGMMPCRLLNKDIGGEITFSSLR